MAYTLAEAQAMLVEVKAAYSACLKGQAYTIKDRSFTKADLRTLSAELKRWEQIVDNLTNGGSITVKRVVPRDL